MTPEEYFKDLSARGLTWTSSDTKMPYPSRYEAKKKEKMSEEFTGYTASFRPGGSGYDSPLVVVRASSVEELLEKLSSEGPNTDLSTAVYEFDQMLKEDYVGSAKEPIKAAAEHFASAPSPTATGSTTPIWAAAQPAGLLTPNPDGTYPPCPHGSSPRKVWTSPRNGKRYLFCKLGKGTPGACESVVV